MARLAAGRSIRSPLDIANCTFWVEAGSQNVETAGSGISQWTDLSGNANHATQSTDANRPTLSSVSGIPSVKFSDASDYLESLTGSGATDHTMFGVARWTAAAGGLLRALCGWGSTLGQSSYMGMSLSGNVIYGDQGASAEGVPIVTNTVYLMSKVRQAANDVGQRGRAQLVEGGRSVTAPTNTTGTRIAVGKDSSGNNSMVGDIFTIIMYARALSFGEVVAVERYIAAKYAPVLGL